MSRRLIAVFAVTVTVLLVGAGSLYAYDKQVRTRIADGVTVRVPATAAPRRKSET